MQKRVECRVTGRVQMVLYRDFTRRQARSLGLVGFVKNNPDGSVTVIAEGEEEKLRTFIEYLKKGPLFARVNNVRVERKEATGEFSQFEIVY